MKTTELTMKLRITTHDNGSIGTGIELYRNGGFIGTSELKKEEAKELVDCAEMIYEAFKE